MEALKILPMLHGNMTGPSGFDVNSAFYTSLLANPLLFGSLGITLFGFIGYYFRRAYSIANKLFWQRITKTLSVSSNNIEYLWLVDYISKNTNWCSSNVSLESIYEQNNHGKGFVIRKFLPGAGDQYIRYKKHLILAQSYTVPGSIENNFKQVHHLTLTTYGINIRPDLWPLLLEEASKEPILALEQGLTICSVHHTSWKVMGKPRKKRSLDSVILADGLSQKITMDIQQFLDSESWYHETGVPYRRGYLFYGPPGTGKTSFITGLASHFGFNICILSLNDSTLNDNYLNHILNNPPTKSFILMEDIDAVFVNRDQTITKSTEATPLDEMSRVAGNIPKKQKSVVTLSGLLNALDGVASCEGRIIFMTTNHQDHLDEALIRPGRVDCKAFLGHCTQPMIKKMYRRFYPTVTEEQCQHLVDATQALGKSISPAQLQRHFTLYKNEPEEAIEQIKQIF